MAVTFSERYKPLYFLSALGAGGLSVAVFMYPMFLVKHPDTPIPTYEHLAKAFAKGSITAQVALGAALTAMAALALLHLYLMVSNLLAHRRFVRTDAYLDLRRSNTEVTLLAVPLALAMTVNVAFIAGALAIPGLWDVVEYLFPVAIALLSMVGVYALVLFGRYLGRILAHSGFDIEDTNHFSQVLPSFTFAMIGVGFASPAAMSDNHVTSVIGMMGAFFFGVASLMWALVKLPVSVGMMLRQGMAVEAGPTLWIGIPILTLFGIAFIRLGSGVAEHFLDKKLSPALAFVVLGLAFSSQIALGLLGWAVMRRQGYFSDYVLGSKRSVASYGLICPGVAFSVLSMFFIHWGLVKNEVVTMFSVSHYTLLAVVLLTQLVTFAAILRLNGKLLRPAPDDVPASEREAVLA